MAPAIGAAQNNQSCPNASPCTNNACEVERAGFTEVFVIGILINLSSIINTKLTDWFPVYQI